MPAPAPVTGSDGGLGTGTTTSSSPSPGSSGSPAPVPDVEVGRHFGADVAPAPALDGGGRGPPHEVVVAPPTPVVEKESESGTVSWCAVRDEFEDCQNFISLLKWTDGYIWKW